MIEWLSAARITLMHTVPSLAASWVADGELTPVETLRYTFFAGEPLTDGLARRWRTNVAPGGDIVNLYGPTETTLAKCFYTLPADPEPGVQAIGSPLPQCRYWSSIRWVDLVVSASLARSTSALLTGPSDT